MTWLFSECLPCWGRAWGGKLSGVEGGCGSRAKRKLWEQEGAREQPLQAGGTASLPTPPACQHTQRELLQTPGVWGQERGRWGLGKILQHFCPTCPPTSTHNTQAAAIILEHGRTVSASQNLSYLEAREGNCQGDNWFIFKTHISFSLC